MGVSETLMKISFSLDVSGELLAYTAFLSCNLKAAGQSVSRFLDPADSQDPHQAM